MIDRAEARAQAGDSAIALIESSLTTVKGRVLEIGAGTGNLIRFLPRSITYQALEPNVHLHAEILRKANMVGLASLPVLQSSSEAIPLPDNSVDCVLSVRSLCEPRNLPKVLSEVRRVLKPGGAFIFTEHIGAPAGSFIRHLQQILNPFFTCDIARDIEVALRHAGFSSLEIHAVKTPNDRPLMRHRIFGQATKNGRVEG